MLFANHDLCYTGAGLWNKICNYSRLITLVFFITWYSCVSFVGHVLHAFTQQTFYEYRFHSEAFYSCWHWSYSTTITTVHCCAICVAFTNVPGSLCERRRLVFHTSISGNFGAWNVGSSWVYLTCPRFVPAWRIEGIVLYSVFTLVDFFFYNQESISRLAFSYIYSWKLTFTFLSIFFCEHYCQQHPL